MRTLPANAQLFLVAVWLAALAAAGWAALLPAPPVAARGWEVLLYLVLTTLAYDRKVRLVGQDEGQMGSLSLGFAITFAALLRLGPHGALVIGTLGCLVSCLRTKKQAPFQLAFNAAVAASASWLAGLTFLGVNGGTLALSLERSAPAAAAASLAYFALNSGATAAVIGLCGRLNIAAFWRENFLWTAPSYFAGAALGTGAALLSGSRSWLMPVFLAPVAWLTYQAYAVSAGKAHARQREVARLADLYLGMIKSLALAIDAKDQRSHRHILRVQHYAVATAKRLGLSADDREAVNTGALLHDIGKLGVPDYVLLKPGRLTDEEFAKIRLHPEIGAAILREVPFPWPVLPVVRSHHEKWDGSGYPDGLAGEAIPRTARILAVADVYDALTSTRAHRSARSSADALAELRRLSGVHFDPAVVEAFAAVLAEAGPEGAEGGEAEREAVEAKIGDGESSDGDEAGDGIKSVGDAVRQIRRASSELWALYEVAQTLSSSLGLEETLEILGRKLESLLPGAAAVFLLRDGAEDALSARVAVGLNAEALRGACASGLASLSLGVATHRRSCRGAYDPSDLRLPGGAALAVPLRSALIVPVVHGGGTLGTINLYHARPEAFSAHDQQLLEMIAERAALALYNGLLFDRTRSRADTDPLTDLYNFRFLTQKVNALCAEPRTDALALLCLDLDRFKPINDTFGHQAGDRVLCALADAFRQCARDTDIVARYGGDEFLVVLPGAGPAEAEAMAARLSEAVRAYDPGLCHPTLGRLTLGVSVGAACFPQDGTDCSALLSAADARMYGEKAARRSDRAAAPLSRAA